MIYYPLSTLMLAGIQDILLISTPTDIGNFEWVLGYAPTFGLVAVDRTTFERRPKPSAAWLGSVARANAVELPA